MGTNGLTRTLTRDKYIQTNTRRYIEEKIQAEKGKKLLLVTDFCGGDNAKSEDLRQLKFSGKFFISESMFHENHQLAYKCCQLKNAGKVHST